MIPTEESMRKEWDDFEAYLKSCLQETKDELDYSYKFVTAMDCFRRGWTAAHRCFEPQDLEDQIHGRGRYKQPAE